MNLANVRGWNWRERASRWARRNGLLSATPGWPGLVHQTWGWYDSLSSPLAAGFVVAASLFLISTAIYLVGVAAWFDAGRPPLFSFPLLADAMQLTPTIEPT